MKRKIVLASTSPRRQKLLRRYIKNLQVIPPKIDEEEIKENDPRRKVLKTAVMKAESIMEEVKEGIIIAADTIIELDGKIIGKPRNLNEAKEILLELNGRKHKVITGVVVIDCEKKRRIMDIVETEVYMKNLSIEEIEFYVKTKEPLGKAGAYAIQELGAILINKINGCFYNVVGLPLPKLYEMLKEVNVNLLEEYLMGGREH
ncbi:MAG: Maf family protein [archaeon GB-1867-035]|nr:Maf family protein [Candidatus Culexmicrobium profundum]